MAERIQPLSDVGPVRHVPAQSRTPARTPSFSELVHAHHAWWRGRQGGAAPDQAAEAAYDSMHAAFEATPRPDRPRLLVFRRPERGRPDREEAAQRPGAFQIRLPSRDRLGDEERPGRRRRAAPLRRPGGAGQGGVDGRAAADLPRARRLVCGQSAQPGRQARAIRRRGEHRRGTRPRARRSQEGRVLLLRGGERTGAAHLLRWHCDRDPRHRGSRHRLALHQLGRSASRHSSPVPSGRS